MAAAALLSAPSHAGQTERSLRPSETVIAAAGPGPGGELFAQAAVADDHQSYSGTMTSIIYEHDRAASTVVRIDHNAPRSWRIWYVAPSDAFGRTIVSNERLTYQYEPNSSRVYRNDWSTSAPLLVESFNVERIERNYSIDVAGLSSVAGRPTHTLSLISRHTGALVERIWVDDATKLMLRREIYHADGTVASRTSFDNVHLRARLPAALFRLSVPRGMRLEQGAEIGKLTTDIARLRASLKFKFADPRYLPEGFALEKGSVGEFNGVQTAELVYDDGVRMFSLFENRTGRLPDFEGTTARDIRVGSETGKFAYVSGETLLSWNESGMNFTLVGDLTPKELAVIGASVKP